MVVIKDIEFSDEGVIKLLNVLSGIEKEDSIIILDGPGGSTGCLVYLVRKLKEFISSKSGVRLRFVTGSYLASCHLALYVFLLKSKSNKITIEVNDFSIGYHHRHTEGGSVDSIGLRKKSLKSISDVWKEIFQDVTFRDGERSIKMDNLIDCHFSISDLSIDN